jgi:DNA adenine methylase
MQGAFNVPFGNKSNPMFPATSDLALISKALKKAALRSDDYSKVLARAGAGDLVYLDPPYPPLNGTAYFTHYTADRFSLAAQERLAGLFGVLNARGCLLMMTNADTPLIRRLYQPFQLAEISVPRYVTCKKVRHSVGELVITNYDPPDQQ